MSVERVRIIQHQVSQKIHDSSMQAVEKLAGSEFGKKLMRGTSSFLIERGINLFRYNGLEEAIDQTGPFLENGHKLVILSTHKSHGEIAPAIFVMEEFMKEYPEFLNEFELPVAESMAGGQQGEIIKTLYEDGLKPSTKDRNIKTIPVVTDNDVKKRGMVQNKLANGKAILEPLKRNDTGFFIFIEGSVQGGRENPETGDIYGLQEPDSMLKRLLEYSKRSNTPLAFVMTGMTNTHNLLSADGKFFTPEWVRAMAVNHFKPDAKYADVNMSKPISTNDLDLDDLEQTELNLMTMLASCVPKEERGMFKNVDYLLNT